MKRSKPGSRPCDDGLLFVNPVGVERKEKPIDSRINQVKYGNYFIERRDSHV